MKQKDQALLSELREITDDYENDMISKKELIYLLKEIVLYEAKFIDNPYTSVTAKELMERYKNV